MPSLDHHCPPEFSMSFIKIIKLIIEIDIFKKNKIILKILIIEEPDNCQKSPFQCKHARGPIYNPTFDSISNIYPIFLYILLLVKFSPLNWKSIQNQSKIIIKLWYINNLTCFLQSRRQELEIQVPITSFLKFIQGFFIHDTPASD